jgi:hypothetical protein
VQTEKEKKMLSILAIGVLGVISWKCHIIEMVVHGLLIATKPVLLFDIQRKLYGDIFPVQLGFERCMVFTGKSLGNYWNLMTCRDVDPLSYRNLVLHLHFPHINVLDLEKKTRISKTAVVAAIQHNDHGTAIQRIMDDPLMFLKVGRLEIENLDDFSFTLVSQSMMDWLLGSELAQLLSIDFYSGMNYYSTTFAPLLSIGFRLKNWRNSWFIRNKPVFRDLSHHQQNIEKCLRQLYRHARQRQEQHQCDDKKQRHPENLVDYYLDSGIVSEDDFVWLMNATLWAAIHYPMLILSYGLSSVFRCYNDLQQLSAAERKKRIYLILKNILSTYSAALLPTRLKQDVVITTQKKSLVLKAGTCIAFSPYYTHAQMHLGDPAAAGASHPIFTGSRGDWSCPAINFTLDFLMTVIVSLMDKYPRVELPLNQDCKVHHQLLLLHSPHPIKATLLS